MEFKSRGSPKRNSDFLATSEISQLVLSFPKKIRFYRITHIRTWFLYSTLESCINIPLLTFIIFWNFCPSCYEHNRLKFYYLHKFAYFKELHLFFLSNFPEATFIQGTTFIPESQVHCYLQLTFLIKFYW